MVGVGVAVVVAVAVGLGVAVAVVVGVAVAVVVAVVVAVGVVVGVAVGVAVVVAVAVAVAVGLGVAVAVVVGRVKVMSNPSYTLVGGPLDGATQFAGTIAGFPDGTVAARVHGLRAGYWLLYRGEVSFCGRPSQLRFVGWMPFNLHPTERALEP